MTARICSMTATLVVIATLCGTTCAATESDAERQRIAAERAAALAHYAQQERECQSRFVVTSCIDAARKEQRAVLARLHAQEMRLDDARRHESAALRRQALADKAAAQQGHPEEAAPAKRDGPRHAPTPNPPASSKSAKGTRPDGNSGSASPNAGRHAVEAQSKLDFEAKARAIEAHREAVERRNAQRASGGKKAAPLPVPGASAP